MTKSIPQGDRSQHVYWLLKVSSLKSSLPGVEKNQRTHTRGEWRVSRCPTLGYSIRRGSSQYFSRGPPEFALISPDNQELGIMVTQECSCYTIFHQIGEAGILQCRDLGSAGLNTYIHILLLPRLLWTFKCWCEFLGWNFIMGIQCPSWKHCPSLLDAGHFQSETSLGLI